MIGAGEATGHRRALRAAEAAIANPLLDEASMRGARGLLVSITGSKDLTLYELDEAASRIRQEVDDDANIIVGATFDPALEDAIRVAVVATGIDRATGIGAKIDPSTVETADAEAPIGAESDAMADAETEAPLAAAVIPFPEPNQRRKGVRGASRGSPCRSSSVPSGEARRRHFRKAPGATGVRLVNSTGRRSRTGRPGVEDLWPAG